MAVIEVARHDVQKFEQNWRSFTGRDDSTVGGMWFVTALNNKRKQKMSAVGNGVAQVLLINPDKKRIYSSYANCNDSWFFFEGQDSNRAHV